MKHLLLVAIAGLAGVTMPANASTNSDIWTEISRQSPHRPEIAVPPSLRIADWKDDIWVETDRKSPHRPTGDAPRRHLSAALKDGTSEDWLVGE